MSSFTGFLEKSFFFFNLKYGQVMGSDALSFSKELDFTDCSKEVLERLDF